MARRRRILVVDDDPEMLCLISALLGDANYAVTTAASGAVALQILRGTPMDLVVLELNMPQPDGFEVLKTLRTERPRLKILVLSAYVRGVVLKASELVGATASMSKLDVQRDLVSVVGRLVG